MRKLPLMPSLKRMAEEELAVGMSDLTFPRVKKRKPYLSVDFIPIRKEEEDTGRMDIVYCKGTPYLTCCEPVMKGKRFKEFFLSSDWGGFLREMCTCRFSSYDDFVEYAKTDKNANLLLHCTNLSRFHFDLAAENYGVKIPIGWDFEKYFKAVGKPTSLSFKDYDVWVRMRERRSQYLYAKGRQALRQSIGRITK